MIARPFVGINKKVVISAIISGLVFWFLIAVGDIVCEFKKYDFRIKTCYLLGFNNIIANMIAVFLMEALGNYLQTDSVLLKKLPIILTSIVPSLATLVCIPVQIYHVRKSLSSSPNQVRASSDADHVTMTIILIGILSLVCNCMTVVSCILLCIQVLYQTTSYLTPSLHTLCLW